MEVLILNSMVQKVIFRNILRINRTLDNHLPTHGSSVYDLNQIHEILLGLEAADKLGVIWRAEREKITDRVSTCIYYNVTINSRQPSLNDTREVCTYVHLQKEDNLRLRKCILIF